jgi:hypothetical protein
MVDQLVYRFRLGKHWSGWMSFPEILELYEVSPGWANDQATLEHKRRYTPLRDKWSSSTPLHRAVTPLLQFASSRRKPYDPAACPPA